MPAVDAVELREEDELELREELETELERLDEAIDEDRLELEDDDVVTADLNAAISFLTLFKAKAALA